jgi:hypothetical protein
MGKPGNGDGWPDSGGLPDLPPDWGSIVIPDDPAELAAEAALLRRELRQQARRTTWRRRLGLPPVPGAGGPVPPLRLPLIIVSIAVLATLTSLFAVAWPGQQRPAISPRTGNSPTTSSAPGHTLPALDLVGEDGGLVPLRGLLPAVIIFVDGCTCADEVDAAASIAPVGVTVLALTSGRPAASPLPRRLPIVAAAVRSLADPAGELRGFLQPMPRPGAAPALLAARSGEVVRILPSVTALADHQTELAQLAAR